MSLAVACLCISIAASTVMWPLNRWVTRSGARPLASGCWLSLLGAALAAPAALAAGQDLLDPVAWAVGAVVGAAFAFGYCFALMKCVQIGPLGPSAAVNNMGLLWPVVLGAVWLDPHPLGIPAWIGLAAVVAALVLFGFGSAGGGGPAKRMSLTWGFWALATWVAAGVAMSVQLVGMRRFAVQPISLVCAYLATSALFLLPFAIRGKVLAPKRGELLAGAGNGALQVVSASCLFFAIRQLPVEIAYPFAIGAPLIFALVLGRVVYRDAVSPAGWNASALGIAGLVLLSLR
jgi:drug/metabolite transporter (DMT)-like permease